MFRKGIIAFVVVLVPFFSHGQVAREKKALKYIRDHRYHSAYVLLKKALAKDDSNIKAQYVLGQYYTKPQNDDYHLDSAYAYSRQSIRSWSRQSPKERSRLRRFPLDSALLLDLKTGIERKAFDEASRVNTEDAYNHFISFYEGAREQGAAVTARNKVAFRAAEREDTPAAFQNYRAKYPGSAFEEEAMSRYQYLVFQDATAEKNLNAYLAFLSGSPESPYVPEVERRIFEIITADGSVDSLLSYVGKYPDRYFSKRAQDLIYHILSDDQRMEVLATLPRKDSLITAAELERTYAVPFLEKGKFGLMDSRGKVIVDAVLDEIEPGYSCGNISDDLLLVPGRLITRNGETVFSGQVLSRDDLGFGFLLLEQESGHIVLHKSGYVFPEDSLQDARVIRGKLLAVKRNDRWGLFTFAGREIIGYELESIDAIGEVVCMGLDGKVTLATIPSLAATINNEKGKYTDAFDEVKKFGSDKVWIRVDKYEGILDQKLEILVKVDTHQLKPAFFGTLSRSSWGWSTFNEHGEESEYFEKIDVVNPWVAAKNKTGWFLYDPSLRIAKSVPYDSVSIYGPFAVGIKKDGIEIHPRSNPGNVVILPPHERIELVPGNDSIAFLLLQKDKTWTLYNVKGQKLFTGSYEHIQYAGNDLFIVSNKDKKGVVNAKGKLLVPLEYDAIGTSATGLLSILKGAKFGFYDYRKKVLIKPEYEKNVVRYNDHILAVFKNGVWGFVTNENKPIAKLEFSEMMAWTDSLAFLRMPGGWMLFDVYARKPVMENIRSLKVVRDSPSEKVFILERDNEMGVISNRKGTIIPFSFSDVVNVGSPEVPLYFTEKHVAEASLFVVIYYNERGAFIRKEVYEQDDYEQIYCHQKDER